MRTRSMYRRVYGDPRDGLEVRHKYMITVPIRSAYQENHYYCYYALKVCTYLLHITCISNISHVTKRFVTLKKTLQESQIKCHKLSKSNQV